MPWQVKWVCIGLNALMAAVIGFIAIFSFVTKGFWLGAFFGVWALVAAYSAYEMNKIRVWFIAQSRISGQSNATGATSAPQLQEKQ